MSHVLFVLFVCVCSSINDVVFVLVMGPEEDTLVFLFLSALTLLCRAMDQSPDTIDAIVTSRQVEPGSPLVPTASVVLAA
jgi:hypothetical protein